MEISSTREAISAESTHETKTTSPWGAAYLFMSDKANLLDIVESGKVGRFVHYMLDESAAMQ